MKRLPKPKTYLGLEYYTDEQLVKYFGRGRFNTFSEWMRGQTQMVGADGEIGTYPWDVQRFVNHQAILD